MAVAGDAEGWSVPPVTELAAEDTMWKPAGTWDGPPEAAVTGLTGTSAARTIATTATLSRIRTRFPPGVSGVYAGDPSDRGGAPAAAAPAKVRVRPGR